MFRFLRLRSRLNLIDIYFDIASQEELSLVECNFILLQKNQFSDMLFEGYRDKFSNIKPCRNAYLKMYDYDLMFLDVGECIFDFNFTKDKLFLSKVNKADQKEKINKNIFEEEQRECFMRIHYLSSYFLFFYYAGFKYKSFRYRTNKIFNILQNYRNREFAYDKISNDMFPAFQKSLNRTLFSEKHKKVVDGMLHSYQIIYGGHGEVFKNSIDSMVVEPDLIINWD